MKFDPKEIWTFLLVTLVTVLIWIWAAGELRDQKTIDALVQYTVPEPANWVIRPDERPVTLVIEGSQVALQRAQALLRQPLTISISPSPGVQNVDLFDRLRRHDELLRTFVSVISVDPQDAETELDQIERFTAPIKPVLPGITTEGEVVIDPPEALVAMPSRLRARVGQGFSVEAAIERSELDRLTPGVPQAVEVKLRLPEGFASSNDVSLTPSRARLTFTIRSRMREVKLDSVRVQLASPPEDRDVYGVDIDPKQLQNVTISADAELARRIENNEVPVIALLQLGSREKEARIESKRITCFLALIPEPGGGTRGEKVIGKVGETNEMPVIKLNITRRGE